MEVIMDEDGALMKREGIEAFDYFRLPINPRFVFPVHGRAQFQGWEVLIGFNRF